MADYKFIDVQLVRGVARFTANRPEVRNAQSRRLLEELDDAFARAARDPQVKVIALFGAGEHFSGGHDLGTAAELADRSERPLEAGLRGRFDHSRENFVDKTLRWRDVPKPTIAGVQGYRDPLLEENVMGQWRAVDQSNYGKDFCRPGPSLCRIGKLLL